MRATSTSLHLVHLPGGGTCVCHVEQVDAHGRAHVTAAERDPGSRWSAGEELVVPSACVQRQGWLMGVES